MTLSWPELWAMADHGLEPAEPAPEPSAAVARRLCTGHNARTGKPCKLPPIDGATVCIAHGGKAPQVKEAARRRVEEREAWAAARQLAPDEVDVRAYGDPIDALEWGLAYSRTLAQRLARIVDKIPDDQLRYQGKWGEQVRGELTAVQKALADLNGAANAALRLGLAERRQRLDEATLDVLERAVDKALAASGADLDGQDRAMTVLRAELKAVGP